MERKTAIIVGASSDIGKEIVRKLEEKAWSVYGTYYQHKESLDALLGEANSFGINLDSADSRQQLIDMIKRVWQREGQINAGIYIAGLWYPSYRFIDEDEERVREMWNVNYHGAYWFFRALVPYAIQTRNANLIAVSSTAGIKGSPHAETYGATKAALTNLMTSLAQELANHGIKANTISPGPVNTKAFRQYYPDERDVREVVKSIPLNRLAEPKDIASTICYLLDNEYVTRQNIILDGASVF